MRMCSIADAAFSSATAQVVFTAAVGTNRNTTIAAEALASGFAAAVQLTLSSPYMESMFTEHLPPWRTLAEWSHRHALHLLKTDLQYFNRPATELFGDCTGVVERLEALRQNIERSDPESLFVRLGWGTGWRTMTADLLDDEQRRRLLPKSTQLGPKTRKVIIADGSRNALAIDAFGWISLTPISEAEALNAGSSVISSRRRPTPTPAMPESQPSIVYQGDVFLQAVATLQAKDWGRLADFYRRAMSDSHLKESRLAALGAKVYQIWKGDKRRLREAAEKFPELAGYLHPGNDRRTP